MIYVSIKYAIAYNIYMSKHTDNTILIDSLLLLVSKSRLTSDDLMTARKAHKLLPGMPKHKREQKLGAALRYMKYNWLIFQQNDGFVSVTKKAKKRIEKINIEHLIVSKPKMWDKKWRLVMFEIPSSHKSNRDAFAQKLRQMGFAKLQDSVYAYPFPCQHEISQICEFYGLSNYVVYADKVKLDNDSKLQKSFSAILT